MYLLYAPVKKFGSLPPNTPLLCDEVCFYKNLAYCPTQFWKKVHVDQKCIDVTPRFMRRLRKKRKLKSIAIFATGGIGDSIWIMPFARAIYERNPGSKIAIITDKRSAPVWYHIPYIAATVSDKYWNVQNIIRKSDEAYHFGGIATVLKKEKKLDPVEATFKYAEEKLPKDKNKLIPLLRVTLDEGKRGEAELKKRGIDTRKDKIITIGVMSSTPNRNWPIEYCIELTNKLTKTGNKVIWIGSKKQKNPMLDNVTKENKNIANLIGQTTVRDTMAVIALSDLYIGPNSGPMVIAASLRIATIGLFGAFNPKLRAKFYKHFKALWGKPKCAPCEEHWTECRYGYPAPCMKMIHPKEVFEDAKYMLKKYPRKILEKIPME